VDVSVVIVSYNARDALRRCLDSLRRNLTDVEYEVLVVDNASKDGSPELVGEEFPWVRLIRGRKNVGLARATNVGIAAARGEFLLWLNPDCELRGVGVGSMVDYIRDHPDVGALGPRLVDPDGTLQLSCRRFPGLSTAIFNRYSLATRVLPNNPLSRRYLMTDWDHATVREVDWVSGACMLLPRWLLLELDGLDEAFFMYIEDVDLCYRIREVGLKVVYFPRVAFVHQIGASTRSAPVRMVWERHRSMWHYYRKHLASNPLVDTAIGMAILFRAFALLLVTMANRGTQSAMRARRPVEESSEAETEDTVTPS
jgi:GT2 family glycosyltransferase